MAAPHLCALHAYIPGCVCLFCGRINCLTAALCSVRVRAFAQCFLWACCCRLREGQGPGDEVAELIADLVFWPFFPQLSARTALFCSLWSLVTPLRRVSFPPVFTHFPMRRLYLLIKRATPEFVHLALHAPSLAAEKGMKPHLTSVTGPLRHRLSVCFPVSLVPEGSALMGNMDFQLAN